MNFERYLDYGITFLLIIVVVALVLVSSYKVKEPFTELYFENHTNLPKYTSNNGAFEYAIHNMENSDYGYDLKVIAELYNDINSTEPVNIINLDSSNVILKNDEIKVLKQEFSLNNSKFEKAKIKVAVKNSTQDIHFWTFYAREFTEYENIGYGMLDCVEEIREKPFSKVGIKTKGSYAQGRPIMEFWFDGKPRGIINVANETREFVFNVNGTKGVHFIDVSFTNDYYNKTTKEDRNLYVESINVNHKSILIKNLTIDMGPKEKAFDCQNIKENGNLYSAGAVRVKVEVR